MGAGVRRAGRKSDLAPMEATPPAITAGLADARRVPSTLPDMERTAPATSSRLPDNGQTERTHLPLPAMRTADVEGSHALEQLQHPSHSPTGTESATRGHRPLRRPMPHGTCAISLAGRESIADINEQDVRTGDVLLVCPTTVVIADHARVDRRPLQGWAARGAPSFRPVESGRAFLAVQSFRTYPHLIRIGRSQKGER